MFTISKTINIVDSSYEATVTVTIPTVNNRLPRFLVGKTVLRVILNDELFNNAGNEFIAGRKVFSTFSDAKKYVENIAALVRRDLLNIKEELLAERYTEMFTSDVMSHLPLTQVGDMSRLVFRAYCSEHHPVAAKLAKGFEWNGEYYEKQQDYDSVFEALYDAEWVAYNVKVLVFSTSYYDVEHVE